MFSVGIVIGSLFKCFYFSSIGFRMTFNGGCKMVFPLSFKVYRIELSAKMGEINALFFNGVWPEKEAKTAEDLQRQISIRKKI